MRFAPLIFFAAVALIWIIVSYFILFGFEIMKVEGYTAYDYCSVYDSGLVEYCMIGGKPLWCDTEWEQKMCQDIAKELDDFKRELYGDDGTQYLS